MTTILYYLGFSLGIILLVALIFLWIFLEIRAAARFLMSHHRPVPPFLKNSGKPIFKMGEKNRKTKKEEISLEEETQLLEDEVTELIDTSK